MPDKMKILKNGAASGGFAFIVYCPKCSAMGFCSEDRIVAGQKMIHRDCTRAFMIQEVDVEAGTCKIVWAGQDGYKYESEEDIVEL